MIIVKEQKMSQYKLTIGWACHDDIEGAFWTASCLRMYHTGNSRTCPEIQLLMVDDLPKKTESLENLCALSGAKYVHAPKDKGPAHAKNSVFENADGEYVLLLDSHVILQAGAIDYIMNGINGDFIGRDMWCGPLLNENKDVIATHMDPKWRGDFFGIWNTKNPLPPVSEIPMHGTAMFLMKKEHWPGFSPNFSGFAGEEGYVHELVRKNGGTVRLHTALGWIHRFLRSKPITYRLDIIDKIYNYMIAYFETGKNPETVANWFLKNQPKDFVERAKVRVLEVHPDAFEKYKDLTDVPDEAK